MARKLNRKKQVNDVRPVSHEEFNNMLKVLLNTPPRKKSKGKK